MENWIGVRCGHLLVISQGYKIGNYGAPSEQQYNRDTYTKGPYKWSANRRALYEARFKK